MKMQTRKDIEAEIERLDGLLEKNDGVADSIYGAKQALMWVLDNGIRIPSQAFIPH